MEISKITNYLFKRYTLKTDCDSFLFQLIGAILYHSFRRENDAMHVVATLENEAVKCDAETAIKSYYKYERFKIIQQLVWASQNKITQADDVVEIPYQEMIFDDHHGIEDVLQPYEARVFKENDLLSRLKERSATDENKVSSYLAAIFLRVRHTEAESVVKHDVTKLLRENLGLFTDLNLPEPSLEAYMIQNDSRQEIDTDDIQDLYSEYRSTGEYTILEVLIDMFSKANSEDELNEVLNALEQEACLKLYTIPFFRGINYNDEIDLDHYSLDSRLRDMDTRFFFDSAETRPVLFRTKVPEQIMKLVAIDIPVNQLLNADIDKINEIRHQLKKSTKKIMALKNLQGMNKNDKSKLLEFFREKAMLGISFPQETKMAIEHSGEIPEWFPEIYSETIFV